MDNFLYSLALWFTVFIFYSFLGWIYELIVTFILVRHIYNRGFLIGPVCPIYGCGVLLISALLGAAENPIVIFCVGLVGGALFEYLVSFVMEKLFRVRWWDYTNMPFNLNGRICLWAAVIFGALSVLVIKVINPWLLGWLGTFPPVVIFWIASILCILFLADLVISLTLIVRFRVVAGTVERDASEEISQRVRKILSERSRLDRRLVKAFPNFQLKLKPKTKPTASSKHAAQPVEKSAK